MIVIDVGGPGDLADLCRIEQACFSRPWSAQSLRELLDGGHSLVLVARVGQRCVGYLGARVVAGECEIMNIGVLPPWRRQGVASALFARLFAEAAARQAESVFLEVRASNLAALALYEKLGFAAVGRRKNYYDAPVEDAVILRAALCPSPTQKGNSC